VRAVALIGLTLLVVRGSLLARVRRVWPALLSCPMCLGFWIGAADGTFSGLRLPSSWTGALYSASTYAGVVSLGATVADFLLAWLDHGTGPKS
jgi:hypothetical protein